MAEVVLHALSPKIVVFSSDEVKASCAVNGLRNLDELFKPWQTKIEKVSILSSLLTPTVHSNFSVRFVSHESLLQAQNGGGGAIPYSPEVVVDVVANLVAHLNPAQNLQYDVLRDVLLASSPIAEHETLNHPVSFLLAASTQSEDPIRDLHRLHATASSSPVYTSRGYMDGTVHSIQRFWLLVHDIAVSGGNLNNAHTALAQVKKTFGPHAGLLVINSRAIEGTQTIPTSPLAQVYIDSMNSLLHNDPFMRLGVLLTDNIVVKNVSPDADKHYAIARLKEGFEDHSSTACRLTSEDIDAIRGFLREYVSQSLVPWMEARVREWNEIYVNSRRGITGRLFGAGRKLFGSGRSTPNQNLVYNSIRGYYPPTAPDSLSRKLGDFAFLLRDYRMAGNVYDSIRRDYAQDGALKLAASATEMYCLATLMIMGSMPVGERVSTQNSHLLYETQLLLDQCTSTFLARPQTQIDAIRAGILHNEAWKAFNLSESLDWSGLSRSLVQIATGIEDVPSAILMEQASQADMHGTKRLERKHALHSVMAARRFEQSGQKALSGACLDRALNCYRNQSPPWVSAQHYLEYALGRQAYTMGDSLLAVEHFLRMLRDNDGHEDQSGLLENLTLAYRQLEARPEYTDNIFSDHAAGASLFQATGAIILPPTGEEEILAKAADFREPSEVESLPSLNGNSQEFAVGVGECFRMQVEIRNPLHTPLRVTDINVQADYTKTDDATMQEKGSIKIQKIPDETIAAQSSRVLTITMSAPSIGRIKFGGFRYRFHGLMWQHDKLSSPGRRLHAEKKHRMEKHYGEDRTLTLRVLETVSRVRASVVDDLVETMQGAITPCIVRIRNTGTVPLISVNIASDHRHLFVMPQDCYVSEAAHKPGQDDGQHRTIGTFDFPSGQLSPGEHHQFNLESCFLQAGKFRVGMSISGNDINGTTSVPDCIELIRVVEPSVGISATIDRPANTAQEAAIVMTIVNNTSVAVALSGICIRSTSWKISDHTDDQPQSLTLLAGESTEVRQNLTWLAESDLNQGQNALEIEALKALGLEAPTASKIPVSERQSSRSFGPTEPVWPTQSTWQTWTAQQARAMDEPLLSTTCSAINMALLWAISPSGTQGSTAISAIEIPPRHSPLLPTLSNLLKADKASSRAMYEETNTRRRQLLTGILTGEAAVEDNPLQVTVEYVPPAQVPDSRGHNKRTAQIRYILMNTSPLYPVRYSLRIDDQSRRTWLAVGSRQKGGMLEPLAVETWTATAIELSDAASQHCLTGWTADVTVGHSKGDWSTRAFFRM